MDRAHVPDVPARSARRMAGARLRPARRLRAALRPARTADAETAGARRRAFPTVPFAGRLVLLARGRHGHSVVARSDALRGSGRSPDHHAEPTAPPALSATISSGAKPQSASA